MISGISNSDREKPKREIGESRSVGRSPTQKRLNERKTKSHPMLRATRLVTASKRGFATVVDAAPGFKVAAVDNGQPTSSVTVLLKAGSRYESKPGVAHTLSNFAFKVRPSFTTDHSMFFWWYPERWCYRSERV